MMLSMGEHPKVVQERLGHSPISLTIDTHSHVLPTVDKMTQEPLSAFLPVATGWAGWKKFATSALLGVTLGAKRLLLF
jgi:hypothetical protein